ncbi:hypothetical protein AXK56_14195 [Tsukamurella pulmonis]|uniref:LppP/LprE lipoprotein n=1 Tax=Tsukamurella pulmonis TaxID=47312 RepID=A0A1H1FLZ0_9ACTN|nr:LppP/LprE family lipoprotein [Tsukamurella pulmonis]KXO87580.1 hypothetical protein AXK56_14195 [Tsukamurella pulmonis]SDR01900.1 LppP/LprE lipoprotein [Tsukamurella pulmonis]SUP19193.1 Uncharacterised protein [Tsukamurella pulmonis]
MRKPLTALALSAAAAATGIATATVGAGTAGAAPVTCPEIPQDRIDSAIASIAPPMPGVPWVVEAMGGSVDCTLNWVSLGIHGTVSSPRQVLLFDRQKFAGTPTKKAHGYTSVVGSNGPGQITVRFKWLNPGDANANPPGSADVRFQTMPQDTPQPLDPIPPQVAD